MAIPFIIANSGSLSAVVQGRSITIPKTHRFYDEAVEALRNGDQDKFLSVADLKVSITNFIGVHGVKVIDGEVYYRDNTIHNVVTERIVQAIKQGLPYLPFAHFLDNLLLNPSRHSVQQLYNFLENQHLPITDDGCFLAYKRVNDNWLDFHTQSIDNSIGKTVSIPRNEVDDDFSQDCSYGLHVGSIAYVRGFNSGGHIILVKVNPKDAVSVPQYDSNKMRVCEYLVVEEASLDVVNEGLSGSLYDTSSGVVSPVSPTTNYSSNNGEEDTWEEEEDDDEYEDEDEEFDDEEDEEDEEDDVTLSPTLLAWATSNQFDTSFFDDPKVQNALKNKDGVGVVQYLYGVTVVESDSDCQTVLEDSFKKAELIRIVENS